MQEKAMVIFKRIRYALMMEQKEIAKELGITKAAYSLYEKGERMPRVPILRKIIEMARRVDLNYTFEDFYETGK